MDDQPISLSLNADQISLQSQTQASQSGSGRSYSLGASMNTLPDATSGIPAEDPSRPEAAGHRLTLTATTLKQMTARMSKKRSRTARRNPNEGSGKGHNVQQSIVPATLPLPHKQRAKTYAPFPRTPDSQGAKAAFTSDNLPSTDLQPLNLDFGEDTFDFKDSDDDVRMKDSRSTVRISKTKARRELGATGKQSPTPPLEMTPFDVSSIDDRLDEMQDEFKRELQDLQEMGNQQSGDHQRQVTALIQGFTEKEDKVTQLVLKVQQVIGGLIETDKHHTRSLQTLSNDRNRSWELINALKKKLQFLHDQTKPRVLQSINRIKKLEKAIGSLANRTRKDVSIIQGILNEASNDRRLC